MLLKSTELALMPLSFQRLGEIEEILELLSDPP